MKSEALTTAEIDALKLILKPILEPRALDKSVRQQRTQFQSIFAIVNASNSQSPIPEPKNRILDACNAIDSSNGENLSKIAQPILAHIDRTTAQIRQICKGVEPAANSLPGANNVNHTNGLDQELIDFGKTHGILTSSLVMEDALDNLLYLSELHQGHVLVRGETGTGKELFSKAIHTASDREGQPYVIVDGAAADPNFIKAELLGHEKGAFTGADRKRIGKIEKAGRGVIFIDEIGKWDFEAQGLLLGILAGRRMERMGSNGAEEGAFTIGARIVAATNADLEELVNQGLFLEDLYYRLQQLRIDLPTLRERGEQDIDLLAHHFLQTAKEEQRIPYNVTIGSDAMDSLKEFKWPGNVRQLKHVMEQALVNASRERARQRRLARTTNGEAHPLDVMLHHVNDALAPYKRIKIKTIEAS